MAESDVPHELYRLCAQVVTELLRLETPVDADLDLFRAVEAYLEWTLLSRQAKGNA